MLTMLLDYGGRLHPLLIHFPITLLIVAAVMEVFRLRWSTLVLRELVRWAMLAGAIGAIIAAGSGWLFALQVHRPPELRPYLFWHRWLGVALALLASATAWAIHRTEEGGTHGNTWRLRVLVWATGLLVITVGHLGAVLVWGTDFFASPE